MQTPLTNKLLILNTILLTTILVVIIFVNYDDLKYKLTNESSDYYSSNDEYDEEVRHYLKQDSVKVDFDGLKNDTIDLPETMLKTIEIELDSANWNEMLEMEDLYSLYHETVFAQHFPSSHGVGKSFFVLSYSNSNANLCHACKGKISLFEFAGNNENWQLLRKYLAFGYGDEYGMEPRGIELARIGINNKYAVIVHTGYSGNSGHEMEFKSVYTEVNDSLKLVFNFTSYEHYEEYSKDIEYTEGYSDFRFIESGKEIFDIETKSEYIDWNDKTPGAVKRFVFNGVEYIETK